MFDTVHQTDVLSFMCPDKLGKLDKLKNLPARKELWKIPIEEQVNWVDQSCTAMLQFNKC